MTTLAAIRGPTEKTKKATPDQFRTVVRERSPSVHPQGNPTKHLSSTTATATATATTTTTTMTMAITPENSSHRKYSTASNSSQHHQHLHHQHHQHHHHSESHPASSADANFRAGLKLIQQAYDDRHQVLVEQANHWKWIADDRAAQLTAMAADLAKVESNYAALQKEMGQLEMFRKAIVSMVDQHSGVSLTELEQSILETIEADVDQEDAATDADTSSFMLDNEAGSSTPPASHSRRVAPAESRDQRKYTPSSVGVSSSVKANTSQPSMTRARASTETSFKRSSSIQDMNDSKSRMVANRGMASPPETRRVGPVANGRRGTVTAHASDSSPTGLRKVQKFNSSDNLRSKRNTISSSSPRPIYPNSAAASSSNKRHSSISPLSPHSRNTTSASRIAAASTSFSSNSTPSTSPRQPVTTSHVLPTSLAARTARQHQQQKEYSINVGNTMAHMSGMSTSSADRSVAQDRSVDTRQPSHSNSSQEVRRTHRSSSGATSLNNLSPAAIELLRQQERQQEQEKSKSSKSLLNSSRSSMVHAQSQKDHRRLENHHPTGAPANGSSRSNGARPLEAGQAEVTQSLPGREPSSRQRGDSYARQVAHERQAEPRRHSQEEPSTAPEGEQSQQGSGSQGVDASAFTTLYKEIRDSMDATAFGMFARVVTAFNEGEKTTDETLEEVGKIVKDRNLNQRFCDLIHQAIAEKQEQQESEDVGNETLDPDMTVDIDVSLLLEDEDEGGEVTPDTETEAVLQDEEEAEDEEEGDERSIFSETGSMLEELSDPDFEALETVSKGPVKGVRNGVLSSDEGRGKSLTRAGDASSLMRDQTI